MRLDGVGVDAGFRTDQLERLGFNINNLYR